MTENIDTRIMLRDQPGYEDARRAAVWHSRVPDRYPDAILLAESEQDVIEGVRKARDEGWQVKARAGGHSWTASSLRDGGLLIDLSRLTELTTDPGNRRATVQPGAKGRDLNLLLGEDDLFFPGGHCPTIAIGGFLLQGGWGWLSRKLGPACTNVIAVDVVTADGELRHADRDENTDLLWAARGAGSGYFGIVTRYYLECHPRPKALKLSTYAYPRESMEEVMRWAHAMHDEFPSDVEVQFIASRPQDPPGTLVPGADVVLMVLGFALCDTEEEADTALALLEHCPVREQAVMANPAVPVELEDLYRVFDVVARPEDSFAGDGMWSDADADELVPAFLAMVDDLPTPYSYVLWWPWTEQSLDGCALSITGRHYVSPFAVWPDPAEEGRFDDWAAEQMRRFDHLSKGIQLADENLIARPDSRYMTDENASRLEALRASWDPEGRFHSFLRGAQGS
jgi:FAD/FMN-containing dehydrogenase